MQTSSKNKKLKICLSSIAYPISYPAYFRGGMARYAEEIFFNLLKRNIDVKLVIPISQKEKPLKHPNIICVRTPMIKSKALGHLFFNFFSWPIKRRLVKKDGYQLIHSLGSQSELGLSRLITGKLVLSELNTFKQQIKMPYFTSWKDKYTRFFFNHAMVIWEKISCLSAKKIVAISYGTKNNLVNDYGIRFSKIKVSYLGVDQGKFKKTTKALPFFSNIDSGYLLFVGGLYPRKGIKYLIKAFRIVSGKFPNLVLVLVGLANSDYENKLRNLTRDLGLTKKVKFVGFVRDEQLPLFYSNASLFVFPSLVEGFGVVLIEAMLAGNAVVAFDIDAVNEVVKNGETGILVPPRDVEKFAQAIIKLLSDNNLRKEMEKAAIKRAQCFTWDKHINSLIQTYQEVLNEN